ncbi:MAG: hypothetical protein C4308_08740 [Chitinophagaceae bacterium]
MLKISLCLLGLILIISCNSKSNEPVTKKPEKSDTLLPVTPGVNPYAPVDLSPMDMSYFPEDYPKLKMTNSITTPPVARVIYSRPHKQGRVIFGGLQKYGVPWRLGANEATEIDFFIPVTIAGKKVNPGRYILYCIPFENKWTIVLNQNIDTWGLKIDSTKDLMRFDIPIETLPEPVEYFTMVFKKAGRGAELIMAWDTIEARLPINF